MTFGFHQYQGSRDLDVMLHVVRASWKRHGKYNWFHIGDVLWWQRYNGHDHPNPDISIWTSPSGEPAGFSWRYLSELMVQIHPEFRGNNPGHQMIDLFEQQIDPGETAHIRVGGYSDKGWESFLSCRGYTLPIDGFPRFWQSLDTIAEAKLPDGFQVASMVGSEEIERRDEVMAAAFQRSPAPEVYRTAMLLPGYRRELDLVAESADGTFVAFCIAWLDAENKVVEFEPIGCRPEFRRKGLTRAVIAEGLRRAKTLGAESAVTYTQGDNTLAQRLFKSCGFHHVFTARSYLKAAIPA